MLLLRPLCRSYLSSTSFMTGLRPACRDCVLHVGIASCMSGLRPACCCYVLYVGIASFMSELPVVYVLYDGITSCMSLLHPACRRKLSLASRSISSLVHQMILFTQYSHHPKAKDSLLIPIKDAGMYSFFEPVALRRYGRSATMRQSTDHPETSVVSRGESSP